MNPNSIFAKLWGIRQTQSILDFQPFIQIFRAFNHVADLMSTTSIITNMFIPNNNKQITPHQKNSMNQSIFSSLSCFIACMQGCHSIHQMVNLTNVAKMEFDPTPTYRPITPRYLIRFSSFKIWWHDNMLTYGPTKYWIHPITSY